MSEELGWELYDIFASGIYAFPVYEHNAARRIVRYLLMRGVLDEDIANAIEGHTVDLHTWLSRAGKHMVGEWVIAWLNDRRDQYKYSRHRRAMGLAETDIWGERGEVELQEMERHRRQRRKRTKSSGQSDDDTDVGVELDECSDESSLENSSYLESESSWSSSSSISSQISFASRRFKKPPLNVTRRDASQSPRRNVAAGLLRDICGTKLEVVGVQILTKDNVTKVSRPSSSADLLDLSSTPESLKKMRGRSCSETPIPVTQRSGSFACCQLFQKYYSMSTYDDRVRTFLSSFYRQSSDVAGGKFLRNLTAPLETEPRCKSNRPSSLHFETVDGDTATGKRKKETNTSNCGSDTIETLSSSELVVDSVDAPLLDTECRGGLENLSPDSGRASDLQNVFEIYGEAVEDTPGGFSCPKNCSAPRLQGTQCQCTVSHYLSVNETLNLRSESHDRCPVCHFDLVEKQRQFARKKRYGGHAYCCPAWKIPWTVL